MVLTDLDVKRIASLQPADFSMHNQCRMAHEERLR
jgi:hypothetical protein